MRNIAIWSVLGLALSAGALVAGCDNDAKLARSSVGESCQKAADCDDGLKCLQGACYPSSSSPSGNEAGATGTDTGGTSSGPPAPVLGGDGESCTKRADCQAGLGCFNQRCVAAATGEGGGSSAGPALGSVGETCGLTSDCDSGLACVPSNGGFAEVLGVGSNSIGACTPIDSGLTATGKSCAAECETPADCCELPLALHALYSELAPSGTGANSCAQLASLLEGVTCSDAVSVNAARCFAQATYCDCGKATWACSAGSCVYDTECAADGATPGGCPSYSRSGHALTSICASSGKCEAEAAPADCTTDTSCNGKYVADSELTDVCTTGECTCYKATGGCYRKCNADLDCAAGRSCEAKTKVCVADPACTSDAACAVQHHDFRYKCVDSACQKPCANDLDCNAGGLTGGLYQVCNEQSLCVGVGCSTNDDCVAGPGGVHMFCAETPDTAPAASVSSAITD
jgi:hypothetical protein